MKAETVRLSFLYPFWELRLRQESFALLRVPEICTCRPSNQVILSPTGLNVFFGSGRCSFSGTGKCARNYFFEVFQATGSIMTDNQNYPLLVQDLGKRMKTRLLRRG